MKMKPQLMIDGLSFNSMNYFGFYGIKKLIGKFLQHPDFLIKFKDAIKDFEPIFFVIFS